MSAQRRPRPVVFGEALVDVFPDGTEILGGAPFNAAWHLAALGLDPLFVSAVGRDEPGRRILRRMRGWGMDVAGVATDAAHPTGEVRVTFHGNEPSYDILLERAYDFIDPAAARAALGGSAPALVVHGTLALRNPASASALASLLEDSGAPAFLDVNLRPPWVDRQRLAERLGRARWVKMNQAELREAAAGPGDDASLARGLLEAHGLSEVVVTRGGGGAISFPAAGEPISRTAEPPAAFADAVGAGDAFTAVTVAGLLLGWPRALRMERAVRFASAVCGLRGAFTEDRAWYEPFLAEWGMLARARPR